MVRNATLLHYPISAAIRSILPIVDEFVVAVGAGEPGDHTREQIAAIDSPKVRIIDTVWDLAAYPNGTENAHQTDIAKSHCSGDWLFYLQADEVVHEADLPTIQQRCAELVNDRAVEGLLFNYRHFWGDYDHHHESHTFYKREIRIVRNDPAIHSWKSAQSFRRIPNFDGRSYRQKAGTHKLKVAPVDAYINHYGWARPPNLMQRKRKALDTIHHGETAIEQRYAEAPKIFDYGAMRLASRYTGTHPAVMRDWVANFDWAEQLDYAKDAPLHPEKHKHERLKYRLLSWIEQTLFGGRQLFSTGNWVLLRR